MKNHTLLCLLMFVFLFYNCKTEVNSKAFAPVTSDKTDNTTTRVKDTVPSTVQVLEEATLVPPDYDTMKWTEIRQLIPDIVLDLKYATSDNFVEEQLYECGRCFLRPKVAKALAEVQDTLRKKGLGLKLFDCYRPRPIQQKLWDKVPDARYVTRPEKGSMHNRGAAVDLTIVNLQGEELDMGTGFDYFGKEAYHTYTNHSDTIQANRELLKKVMRAVGFTPIRTEWWHYAYIKTGGNAISDMIWECE